MSLRAKVVVVGPGQVSRGGVRGVVLLSFKLTLTLLLCCWWGQCGKSRLANFWADIANNEAPRPTKACRWVGGEG